MYTKYINICFAYYVDISMVDPATLEQSVSNGIFEDFSDVRDVLSHPNLRCVTSIFNIIFVI